MVHSDERQGFLESKYTHKYIQYIHIYTYIHTYIHISIHIQEKTRAVRELTATVLARAPKMCNFIEWQDKKVRTYTTPCERMYLCMYIIYLIRMLFHNVN